MADIAVFGGSTALSLVLLAVGWAAGLLDRPFPAWAWIATVLLVDVSHVWATLFRVYLDPSEVQRRRALYLGIPAVVYLSGVILYALGSRVFWSVLAYLAVFHFVRQQYGWVAIYRRLAEERNLLDRFLDTASIYNSTVFPIVWWHGHLPRAFVWFVDGDFLSGLPTRLANVLHPVHWTILVAWIARQVYLFFRGRFVHPGKILVMLTTWLCWYVGIVVLNSDYAFTVTNVLIHGIPYMALTWRYASNRYQMDIVPGEPPREPTVPEWIVRKGPLAFVVFLALLAFVEEGLWDQFVYHERAYLFGDAGIEVSSGILTFLVPLLAVPQATHYALDGWIWRAGPQNPRLLEHLGFVPRT